MAEHWKSTPKYWCKYCSTYVRDTKLERQNHEATGKHQGAVKRSLRDLHRGKEREDREKERARREIDRLNGVVVGGASSTTTTGGTRLRSAAVVPGVLTEAERKRQVEQLASMGVSVPDQFRGDLAMAGDWKVTATTVVEERPEGEEKNLAKGVHKRERTEEEQEEEDAVKGLFKKPRRWGRDPRLAGGEGSQDLDALLSGGLTVKKQDDADAVKKEDGEEPAEAQKRDEDVKGEEQHLPPIKKEPSQGEEHMPAQVPALDGGKPDVPEVKAEDGEAARGGTDAPAVVFKKRKAKNIRQK